MFERKDHETGRAQQVAVSGRELAGKPSLCLLSEGQSERTTLGRAGLYTLSGGNLAPASQPVLEGGKLFSVDMEARSELRGQHQLLPRSQKVWS